ncbi:MAG: class I SAM-dependent methyltransferase [Candidatus Zixiibacteriota bacterium]
MYADISTEVLSVLDIGCGVGRWCNYLSGYSNNIIGIDIDHIRLKQAKTNLESKNIELLQASVTDLQFKANSFDLITSVTVLQHIPNQKKEKSIQEINRVTKTNGYAMIMEMTDIFDDAEHVFPLEKEKWQEQFEASGFLLVKEYGYDYTPILRLLRWIQYKITGKKFINRKGNKVRLSGFKYFILWLSLLLSYPLEIICTWLLPVKYSRHVGFLFKKSD